MRSVDHLECEAEQEPQTVQDGCDGYQKNKITHRGTGISQSCRSVYPVEAALTGSLPFRITVDMGTGLPFRLGGR